MWRIAGTLKLERQLCQSAAEPINYRKVQRLVERRRAK